jgi:presenilin-like A22 family membrane protease
MDIRKIIPFLGTSALLLAVQALALLVSRPLESSGITAFEDPSSVWNPVVFVAMLLIFTLFLLILIRLKGRRLIGLFIAASIFLTFLYIFVALGVYFFGESDASAIGALGASIAATILLYKFPEWYVIDALGVFIAAGAAAIFGISLQVLPVLILLALLAIYDAIAVYKTKHMITLAEGVIETKSPILFVIPKRTDYSFIREGFSMGGSAERGAYIMGMGDLIMPTILVVSANVYLKAPIFGLLTVPAIGAIIGSVAGMALLLSFVNSGRPQAGLPPLNGGTIIGFLIGCALTGTWAWIPYI